MPPGANGWQGQSTGWENSTSSAWALGPGARAPSAMPLNKAAPGPKMNGYHNETSTGVIGPHGRNDAVLYDRNQSGVPMQSHMWSMQGQMNMRHSGFPDGGRMQGMPSLRPPSSGDVGLVESMDGLQLSIGGSDSGMTRGQRPKLSEGERQEETDDDMFAMFRFKVVPCSKQFVHDWKECSFAHEGETARRRHPSLHTATPCPDFKSTKACPRGDSCTMAHGPWEAGLHPDAFKTNLCAYGKGCQRRMCFFAHDGSELRLPQPGASQQLCPPTMQHAGLQGPNPWSQGSQQQHSQARHHMPFNNSMGPAQKGGPGHQRARGNMNSVHAAKNGLVPGPQDANVGLGFDEVTMPADRKAADPRGGSGALPPSKVWTPTAQGPGAVAGMNQIGRNMPPNNKAVASAAAAPNPGTPIAMGPGGPMAMGPGGKANHSRRANNNMRGIAGYTAARMAGAPGTPGVDGEGEDTALKAVTDPNGQETVSARGGLGKGTSPSSEWAQPEDTSWVAKLLDSTFE